MERKYHYLKSILVILLLSLVQTLAYAVERASVSATGIQANAFSFHSVISANGRFIAFSSLANNLVNNDSNNYSDVFVKDRLTGGIERVSVSSSGQQANSSSSEPSISADGRFVLFGSSADNLVPDDINNCTDYFVHDRNTGVTSSFTLGTFCELNAQPYNVSLSADGRYVLFHAYSTLLEGGSTPGNGISSSQIILYNLQTETYEIVSKSTSGVLGNSQSLKPNSSPDARYITFIADSSNLAPNDTNGKRDVFVRDTLIGTTERVSISSMGEQADAGALEAKISADGRYVTFTSFATNLVDGDVNNAQDVFVHDRSTKITTIVNKSSNGEIGNKFSDSPSISDDGRYIVFKSGANNLIDNDTNYKADIFVHDQISGITERVSQSFDGADEINDHSRNPIISGNGNYITFISEANNVVMNDTNEVWDIFYTENSLAEPENALISVEKLINNEVRNTLDTAAQLTAGTQYRQAYTVTNNTSERIYQVRAFEGGSLVCNFYTLNPGESKKQCYSNEIVLEGDQRAEIMVSAITSDTAQTLSASVGAYYKGHINTTGSMSVTHYVNGVNADNVDQAVNLDSSQATLLFKVVNTGEIELYRVKTYHDPVVPVDGGWDELCVLGTIKPGEEKYCKRDITLPEPGLNYSFGRAQGANAIISATEIVNSNNPTYFIVP